MRLGMADDAPGGTIRFADRQARGGDTVAQPHLFVVLDAARPHAPPARHSLAALDLVSIGRGAPNVTRRTQDGKRVLAISLPDPGMSVAHAQLARAAAGWDL